MITVPIIRSFNSKVTNILKQPYTILPISSLKDPTEHGKEKSSLSKSPLEQYTNVHTYINFLLPPREQITKVNVNMVP